ncbi:MAG: adenylate/guanylate cyclase domain-containing protein [Verrucomicrobia bacterium]|nr:adenylate/guanylate cyclase domain-containing protein [Verrucomicrobiota bacterium]
MGTTNANTDPVAFPRPRLTRPDFLSSPWPLTVALSGILVSWTLFFGNPLEPLEMRWLDQMLRWRAAAGLAPAVDPHIIHLDIDDRELSAVSSLEAEYQLAARIIRETARLGAKVIVFDVIFDRGSEPLARPILDAIDAAKRQGAVVVLAEAQQPTPGSTGPSKRLRSFPFLNAPYRPVGLINSTTDSDGVLRRYALFRDEENGAEPALALAAYLRWRGLSWEKASHAESGRIRWKELSADFQSQTWRELESVPALLNFRTSWQGVGPAAFRHYTVADLDQMYARTQPAAAGSSGPASAPGQQRPLDHGIVLVAYVATGVADIGPTPLGTNQPRVLLHSGALNDLIQNAFLKRTSRIADASLLALVLLSLGALRRWCRGIASLCLLWSGGIVLIFGADAGLILSRGVVIGAVWLSAAWTAITVLEIGRRYAAEFVARLQLRATMGLYFSPGVLERVLRDPGSMEAQEAELTLLLTDLRNSTPLAELLQARGMFALLNQVFEIQTRAITGEDGSQEHFLGDQFLAYWGAPHSQPDGANRALRAARALIAGMEGLRNRLPAEIFELFGYGVALHHGLGLVGNKGSSLRLDYGIVGDLVNAAARIESLTKFYDVRLLVSREFYAKLTNAPPARVIDRVIVKGKSEAVELLELPGSSNGDDDGRQAALFERYAEAFRFYSEGSFDRAEEGFQSLAKTDRDPPSMVLWKRCIALKQHPPQPWEGIYRLETK